MDKPKTLKKFCPEVPRECTCKDGKCKQINAKTKNEFTEKNKTS